MKKEFLIHFVFLAILFIFLTLFKRLFSLSYWPFWVGGVVGTALPDLDHLLYVWLLRPQEFVSQKFNYLVAKKDYWGSLNLLAETRSERTKLIFHTATFQIVFLVLAFWVLTSSGSLFGKGLVLSFALHLVVDQSVDYLSLKSLINWFKGFPIVMDMEKEKIYLFANILILLVLAFFF